MKENSPVARSHDVAVQIYVDLVARHAQVVEGSVKMSAPAASLAKISLQLAEVFRQTEAEVIAASGPVKDYKLDGGDIAAWS